MIWQCFGYVLAMVYMTILWPSWYINMWQYLTVFWPWYVTMCDCVLTMVCDNVWLCYAQSMFWQTTEREFNHVQTWSATSSKHVWSWLKTMCCHGWTCFDNQHFDWALPWTIWEKKLQTTSCLKVHNRFAPKFSHTPRKGIYQSCIKNCSISICGKKKLFFLWVFNMGVNGEL